MISSLASSFLGHKGYGRLSTRDPTRDPDLDLDNAIPLDDIDTTAGMSTRAQGALDLDEETANSNQEFVTEERYAEELSRSISEAKEAVSHLLSTDHCPIHRQHPNHHRSESQGSTRPVTQVCALQKSLEDASDQLNKLSKLPLTQTASSNDPGEPQNGISRLRNWLTCSTAGSGPMMKSEDVEALERASYRLIQLRRNLHSFHRGCTGQSGRGAGRRIAHVDPTPEIIITDSETDVSPTGTSTGVQIDHIGARKDGDNSGHSSASSLDDPWDMTRSRIGSIPFLAHLALLQSESLNPRSRSTHADALLWAFIESHPDPTFTSHSDSPDPMNGAGGAIEEVGGWLKSAPLRRGRKALSKSTQWHTEGNGMGFRCCPSLTPLGLATRNRSLAGQLVEHSEDEYERRLVEFARTRDSCVSQDDQDEEVQRQLNVCGEANEELGERFVLASDEGDSGDEDEISLNDNRADIGTGKHSEHACSHSPGTSGGSGASSILQALNTPRLP